MLTKVVIFGRSNVGKSTLFNRMVKRRAAIVENIVGVTRDSISYKVKRDNIAFMLYDSAGFIILNNKNQFEQDIQKNLVMTAEKADLIIFLLDSRKGILPTDSSCAKFLRKKNSNVLLVANKSESNIQENFTKESYELGFGEPLYISATHGLGLKSLEEKIIDKIKKIIDISQDYKFIDPKTDSEKFRIAVVGRPNSGKSTLFNSILNKNRVLTGNIPGTTRDSVVDDIVMNDMIIELIDTAGMRRESKILDTLEEKSVSSTLNTIRYAQMVILVIDSTQFISRQDLSIASLVVNEGRALVLVFNKWDLIKNTVALRKDIGDKLSISLSQLKGVKVIEVSALKRIGLKNLTSQMIKIYRKWNLKISTSKLNEWLTGIQVKNSPPLKSGKEVKIKYCSQVNERPPTFVFFTNINKGIAKPYQRYLLNSLRETFDLSGVPIRMIFRQQKNPYSKS